MMFLLMAGGVANEAWAAKVTYHILTLPIDSTSRYNHHMKLAIHSHRLEAVKVIVDNQTTVELPAQYKSPLAKNFKYYKPEDITIGATERLYDVNGTKGTLYDIKAGSEESDVAEGTVIAGTTAEYYVVYEYDESNTIAKLDGSVDYNIGLKNRGFLAYNRGRNNRPAVVPTAKVDAEMLASEDFSYVESPGGITTYWSSGDNKNNREDVESQFHFIFHFEGLDPYNIIIRTSYDRDYTYIEKNDDGDKKFVYKWYKGGQLFAVGNANSYIASDDHKRYTALWSSSDTENPTSPTYVNRNGQFHGQNGTIWNSFVLLNNNAGDGYVFMGTRTVDGNGAVPTPGNDNKYNYLKFDNNNLTINKLTWADVSKNYTMQGIYPIEKVTFKVPTPFYDPESPSDANIVSVSDWVSKYTVDNDPIDVQYLPTTLRRKYCTFNGKFYSDAARTNEITHFSQANKHATEGYQVYLGYDVSASIPFQAITPSASYTTATWYELTDAGSTQEYGRKIKYDTSSSTYKNNGASGEYVKESEFAFVGDPYELKVLYRKGTEDASANTYVTLSTYDTWEIPVDNVAGSFLLQEYKGTGYWNWDVGQPTGAVAYGSDLAQDAGKDAQTITFTVSGLNGSRYIKVTTGGTDVAQIVSVTPTVGTVVDETGTTATVTVQLAKNTGAAKTMTVTIQEYNDNEGSSASGTASVITITQGTSSSSFAGNTVDYHATNSTYVKPLELPQFTYIYNMVDNAGNIAVKATSTQTIFSTLTKASIPTVIFSPFLADEDVTFYSSFTEGNRSNLSGSITQTPATDNADIYVSYTTSHLSTKSIKLDSDQRFKVQLNGEYLYYDTESSTVLSAEAIGTGDYYSWQLEGGDPYAMKIKNVGLNKYVKVASWANDQALGFDATIGNASRFIAMMSNYSGIYEVMAATGNNTPYLYIARPSTTGAETKIYNYTHGADQLRFVLSGEQPVHYHLIDIAGTELLEVSSYNARLALPAEYVSPLVDTYYYYPTSAKAAENNHENNIAEISDDTNEDDTKTDGKGDYHVYVTYTVNDLIGFNNSGKVNDNPYLLKFLEPYADKYYLEDGSDKLTTEKIEAIYPYCNGDGNLNIYGEAMHDEQMNGGSSTRPRWVWFFESANEDPYHVRIHSRSTISYNGISNPTYLKTYAVHFNQDADPDTKHIVTGGALPGVASETPTEYMILGLEGAFKLLTTEKIYDGVTNERRNVTSLEQYWKTYNMLKLHVLGRSKDTDEYSTDESTWTIPDDLRDDLETALEAKGIGTGQWHSYDAYASATRWNGYNDKAEGHEKKVVEKLEHWFQTFDMGTGTFNVESADIPPVLVLLDQHGWEIMRKPLPVTNYPLGDEELAALRVYDSPLVDKYYFYSNATKASGCHKYSLRLQNGKERDQIKVNGVHYSSTSLGSLPPASASGVKSSGVLNDQFVIYTVKEEYAQSYDYTLSYTETKDGDKVTGYTDVSGTETPQPFLVLQNGRFYKIENNNDNKSYISKPIHEHTTISGGNIYDMIVSPRNNTVNILDGGNFIGNNFWYVKPNQNIDEEMGIKWGTAISGAEPLSEDATRVSYQKNNKNGFDPYNMQLQLVKKNDKTSDGRYLTTHMTSANRVNGVLVGNYEGQDYYDKDGSTMITLENEFTAYSPTTDKGSEGYDHTNLQISNQTFMAVSDANGNMQLMPRFDHTKRVSLDKVSPWETQLTDPVDHAKASIDDNNSMGPQTTFFVRPQRFIYHIIDNDGLEALRYTRGGDNYPTITDHFKSPLATDFTYYKDLTLTDGVYTEISTGSDISAKEITGSFADKEIFDVDNQIYVRYSYDEDADLDADKILQGPWFTVKLAGKDLQSSGPIVTTAGETQGTGVNLYSGSKPGTVDKNEKEWQWKFLAAPSEPTLPNGDPNPYYVAPDPYSVKLFNREANYSSGLTEPNPMGIPIKVPNETTGTNRFALLSHPSGGYAFAVAKTYTDNNYPFLNGENMTDAGAGTPVGATTETESDFTYKNGILSDNSQIILNNDITYDYTYNVITNEKMVDEVNEGNKLAVNARQDNAAASSHEFVPYLPESAQSPLLNMDDYKYYGSADVSGSTYTVVDATKLITLYGLYDDIVYVRYNAYDVDKTNFKVPNKKTITDSHVARHADSHDASMNINGGLPYNIIWYNDNMMASTDGDAISDGGSQSLSGTQDYVWYFTGSDPYALKIRHKKDGNYLDGTGTLVAEGSAKQFMLLKKTDYDYGILQETGGTNKLSGYGQTTVAGDPTKFVIFGLSVYDLIYRLIINTTNQHTEIPYRSGDENTYTTSSVLSATDTLMIKGTTQRNLTSGTPEGSTYQLGETVAWGGENHIYSKNVGTVSIGDDLWVPNEFYRPNCTFDFYIEGIYNPTGTTSETALNNRFKGLKLKKLMSDSELIDKTVVVNIVYQFNTELATNSGLGFVTSTDQNLWYTFETPKGTTPYLAHYTNAWGLQAMEGEATRYTNDYLWTPLGDVYGFKMYNRYMIKNSDGASKVMTMDDIAEDQKLYLAEPGTSTKKDSEVVIPVDYGIFELITGDQEGYFRVHPVANTGATKYYVNRNGSDYAVLSTTPSDWTFGLDMTLLEPYYERAGYVGGLNAAGKTAYEDVINEENWKITDLQAVVYNDANIVHYTPGYYRLHSQPGVSGISPVRYASGYLHDIEKTAVSGGIPMHFYSRKGVATTFAGEDGLGSGFTVTNATRGEIPVDSTEVDPSTIFYFSGNGTTDKDSYGNPTSTMQTQGLYVQGVQTDDDHGNAVMTATEGEATSFSLMDIGGAVLLIHDGSIPASRKYFNFSQSYTVSGDNKIYDLKYFHNSPTDDAKWCMQPVQTTATKGDGEMPLRIKTHNGGDGYYYTTLYVPFDVLLPNDGGGHTYNAYTCKKWYDVGVNPAPVPAHSEYTEGKFVPAGTPVIIRTNDESEYVTLTLPNTSPSSSLSCVFTGSYLEKLLSAADPARDVYTLGLPMTSTVSKDGDYVSSGGITAPLPEFANNGIGFYINATPNKEADALQSLWKRNNLYVQHNKIYYRAAASGAPKRDVPQFVPVIFDEDMQAMDDESGESVASNYRNRVYDLQGRCVASGQSVIDGSFYDSLSPGVYIMNGKKFLKL